MSTDKGASLIALAEELADCELAPFPHSMSEYYVVLVDLDLRNRIFDALRAQAGEAA